MPTDTEDSGFLSRWLRRKAQVRQGEVRQGEVRQGVALGETTPPASVNLLPHSPLAAPAGAVAPVDLAPPLVATPPDATAPAAGSKPVAAEPSPTLADVAALSRDSDYSRFVARSVQPDVKNAALAKLFTDPHFNVMDGLDTYIDDYGKPDPLPAGMLRQLLQSHVLGLFDHEADATNPIAPAATTAPAPCEPAPPTEPVPDENTDLQLQPDDGAGRTGAATGTDQNAGCAL